MRYNFRKLSAFPAESALNETNLKTRRGGMAKRVIIYGKAT
jgi:hypothetical protein